MWKWYFEHLPLGQFFSQKVLQPPTEIDIDVFNLNDLLNCKFSH